MIPCKANKCISYPICLGKIRIDCPDLKEYFNSIIQDDHGLTTHKETWEILQKALPNLQSISQTSVRRFGEYEP